MFRLGQRFLKWSSYKIKHELTTLLLLLVFFGENTMSSISLNPEALDKFKSRINYSLVKQELPTDRKRVSVNWEEMLASINVDDEEWMVEDQSVSLLFPFHAERNALFEKGESDIDIDVHLFSDHSNLEVLEEALIILSRTSMTEINMDYDKNGPCDVYFHGESVEGADERAICVFRNVILEVNASSPGIDIRPVVETFCKKMHKGLIDSNEVEKINITSTISAESVSIEQEFFIKIDLPKDKSYHIKLHQDFNGGLELLNTENNRFNFQTKKRGSHNINISVLDPNTLISSTISFSINVD